MLLETLKYSPLKSPVSLPTTPELHPTNKMSVINKSTTSQLEWLSALPTSFDAMAPEEKYLRKTSIIATIGPKTNSVEALSALRDAGMNIVRMNFSHGSYEYHQSVIDNTRAAAASKPNGRPLAIALDTKGPEIRTGLMKDDVEVKVAAGHEMYVTTDPKYAEACDGQYMYVDYVSVSRFEELPPASPFFPPLPLLL